MKLTCMACLTMVGALLTCGVTSAALIEDFHFNDQVNTALNATPNSANPGNLWIHDTDHAATIQVIGGSGSLNIVKNDTSTVNEGLEFADVSSGVLWMVADFANWALLGSAPDDSNLEDIRFGFMATADVTPPPSSTILAEMLISRSSANGGMQISATALGAGGTNIAPVPINSVQTQPFSMAMMVDQDINQYKLWYKDGAAPYTLVGTGNLEPTRDAWVVRFTVNNFWGDVAGANEQANLDRFYIADAPPVGLPEPTALVLTSLAATASLFLRRRRF